MKLKGAEQRQGNVQYIGMGYRFYLQNDAIHRLHRFPCAQGHLELGDASIKSVAWRRDDSARHGVYRKALGQKPAQIQIVGGIGRIRKLTASARFG